MLTGAWLRAPFDAEYPAKYSRVTVVFQAADGGGAELRDQVRTRGRLATKAEKMRQPKIGYDYVHSLVDDHSRLAHSEVLTDKMGTTCAAFLPPAAAYFAAHGIPRIERLITDNAWAYRHSTAVQQTVAQLGATHKFIKPHCPWQNGKVERCNRTLQTEWAYRQVFLSNPDRAAALSPWLEFYNTRRRHTALCGLPPTSRLSPTL